MKTAKSIFLAISIILFAIGMWPLAIPVAIIYLIVAIISNKQQKEENQELKEICTSLHQQNSDAQAELQKEQVQMLARGELEREKHMRESPWP